jgi:hypothetical protein
MHMQSAVQACPSPAEDHAYLVCTYSAVLFLQLFDCLSDVDRRPYLGRWLLQWIRNFTEQFLFDWVMEKYAKFETVSRIFSNNVKKIPKVVSRGG